MSKQTIQNALGWQMRVIQALAVPGIILAYYLLLFHNRVLVATCGGGGWDDCGAVSGPDAPFSSFGGIPVALIGLLGYIAIFSVIWLSDFVPALRRYLGLIMLAFTGFSMAFTAFLTYLEATIIHAYCRYCLMSAAIIIVMFILSISYQRRKRV